VAALCIALPQNPNYLIINPIHHVGICLAIGAYHTSHLERLCTISGDSLPLDLTVESFNISCFLKLTTRPDYLSHGAVFHPTLCNRHKLNITASWPMGVCFHQLNIFLFFFISVRQFLKYGMLENYPQWDKKCTYMRFFFNNSFDNALRGAF
jgi:hypothetical protein